MSTTYTWYCWNSSTTSTTDSYTSCTAVSNNVWNVWVTGSVTATSCTTVVSNTDTWTYWVDGHEYYLWDIRETEEQQRDRLEREESERLEREARTKKLQEEKQKAEEVAKELLLDLIGKDEMEIYERTGRLLVHGNKYDYMIQREGFVKRIEKDKVTDLCIHLRDRHSMPDSDNVIALKLLVEDDEERFNQLANEQGNHPLESLQECANG